MSSNLERLFLSHVVSAGIELPEREYEFAPGRKWKFDFAWPELMVAMEVEGGTWVNGRHSRGRGYESDVDKYNAAQIAGWSVLRATGDMVRAGRALSVLLEMIEQRNGSKS